MATSADITRSVLAASDELKDIYCEPCAVDGKNIVAEGFCVDCSEYLCGQCYKFHRRQKAFKHHVLQDKDKMPLDATKAGATDVCIEKCTLHQTKVIEYFCQSCDTLGCHACITVNHRQCKDVDHIPNIVKNLEQSEELKEFKSKLDRKLEAVTERKKKINSNKTDIAEMKRKAKVELKKQRDEINKFFDHLEEDMDQRIEDINKNNQKTLTAAAITCDSIHDDLTQMKTITDTKQKTGQKCELFIAMKKYKPIMEAVDKKFETLREESKIERYALTSSSQIKEVIKNTTEICRLTTAKFVSEVNVGTDKDKEDCFIWGLAVVQNHYLAILDEGNKSVKVVDTRKMKVTFEMSIDCDYVWRITNVNDDQIALLVSDDSQDKIQFFSVSKSGSLSKVHKIIIERGYYEDIVYKGGNIYAVGGEKVRIIDMQGKTVKTININEYSNRIAISPDNKTIYLANRSNNTVTSMTLDVKVKAIYTDPDLESPDDITVDSDGLVYVFGLDKIHQLTEDCTKIQVLLQDVHGARITYSNIAKQLYVGLCDKVTVYQLE